MEKLVFNPGCAMSIYKPDMEARILELLKRHYSENIELHNICCRHEPLLPKGSRVINICAGCDKRFSRLYDGVSTISLWEIINQMDDFSFPSYSGLQMSLHDPCPIRRKPQVHIAVRGLLEKMNIEIIENDKSQGKSVCCGDNFYPRLPVEEVNKLMKRRASTMPCDVVCVYCVSCIKSMHIGGRKPRHLLDLLMGEETQVQTYETKAWHDRLDEYIEAH